MIRISNPMFVPSNSAQAAAPHRRSIAVPHIIASPPIPSCIPALTQF
jgi:hypothetical protein